MNKRTISTIVYYFIFMSVVVLALNFAYTSGYEKGYNEGQVYSVFLDNNALKNITNSYDFGPHVEVQSTP